MHHALLATLVLLSVAVAGACGGRAAGVDHDASAGSDAGAEAGPDGGTLAVHVTALSPSTWVAAAPAAGATVALDAPGGGRVEQTADADGRVAFAGLDWSAGTATVTAYLDEGHTMGSRVGITEAEGDVTLPLYSLATTPGFVEVTVTGLDVPHVATMGITVSATVPSRECQARGNELFDPSCVLQVMPGQAFTIVAREGGFASCGVRCISTPISAWATAEVPALTGPTDATVDFAAPVAATAISGSFVMPGRADSPLRGDTYCMAFTTTYAAPGYGATVGTATTSRVAADGSTCDYEAQYVVLPGADLRTRYLVTVSPPAPFFSEYQGPGNLVAGPQTLPFLDVPAFVTPSGSPLAGPLEWTRYDAGVNAVLYLVRSDGSTVWWVWTQQQDVTTLVLPQPPASRDVSPLLGDGDLTANLSINRRDDARGVYVAAGGASITLTR